MKKAILFILLTIASLFAFGQDYCLNNSQKAFNFGNNYSDIASEIIELPADPDGRFLVFGTAYLNSSVSFHIVGMRVFPNGHLDPTFGLPGTPGKYDRTFSQRNTVTCVELQNNGQILVAGYESVSNGTSDFKPYIARLNANGTEDLTFGLGGSLIVPNGGVGFGYVSAMKVLPSGNIAVIGSHTNGMGYTFTRIDNTGAIDPTLNAGAGTIQHVPPNLFNEMSEPVGEILDDGTFIGIGKEYIGSGRINLIKVDADGSLNQDFGIDGKKTLTEINGDVIFPIRSAIDFDGNILVSASINGADGLSFVAKVDIITGELVTGFGIDGIVSVPIQADGMDCHQFVKDEVNQEWVLVYSGLGNDLGTMRINSMGEIIVDCNDVFNEYDLDNPFTQNFTCGVIDSQGILRMSGETSVPEESPFTVQSQNFLWPIYEPPALDPTILSLSPNEILIDDGVELTVKGVGFMDVINAWLRMDTDTITQSLLKIIDDETMKITFDVPEVDLELIDLVALSAEVGPLSLNNSIQLIDERIVDIELNNQSRLRVLAGAGNILHTSVRNTGTVNIVAAPLIYINRAAAEIDFSNQPTYDYLEDPSMTALIEYMNLSMDPSLLNQVSYEYESSVPEETYTSHAFLSSNFPPGGVGEVQGISTIAATGTTNITTIQNPNGLLPSNSIVPNSMLTPPPCASLMVRQSMLEAIPSLSIAGFNDCFEDVFVSNQEDLANTIQEFERFQVLPMSGFLYKLIYEMMECIDPDYNLTQTEFEIFTKDMITRFTHFRVLGEETFCAELITYLGGDPDGIYNDDAVDEANPAPINPDPGLDPIDPDGPNPNPNPSPGDPPGPGGNPCADCIDRDEVQSLSSMDPNEKNGPTNPIDGPYVSNTNFHYDINFENLASADVAAKTVYIVDSLDVSALDLSTFKFMNASWGTNVILLDEAGNTTEVDLRPEVPNILRITTELDVAAGLATWKFETIDTLSLYPTEDVDQGFLPPNMTSPEGMGFVSFNVDLIESVESGTQVQNRANIFFDFNEPIVTNTWNNIFDDVPPESSVNEIIDYNPGENSAIISWDTEDDDVRFYNIYFNSDGGNLWEPWQVGTQDNQAVFEGELGNTYYFKSVAIDSALNVEEYAEIYDAFIFMNPVGIDEISGKNDIKIYPNPADDQLVIVTEEPNIDLLKIMDVTGRIVLEKNFPRKLKQQIISLDEINPGTYIIQFFDEEGSVSETEKLIVR